MQNLIENCCQLSIVDFDIHFSGCGWRYHPSHPFIPPDSVPDRVSGRLFAPACQCRNLHSLSSLQILSDPKPILSPSSINAGCLAPFSIRKSLTNLRLSLLIPPRAICSSSSANNSLPVFSHQLVSQLPLNASPRSSSDDQLVLAIIQK